MEYLEECYPGPSLWGETPYERSMARAWERRAELGILLQATRRFLHTNPFFAPRLQQSSHAVKEAAKTLTDRLSLFDRHLGDSEWLASSFSVADITLFVGIEDRHRSRSQVTPLPGMRDRRGHTVRGHARRPVPY